MTSRQTAIALRPGDGFSQIGEPHPWSARQEFPGQPTGPKIAGFGRAFLRHGKLLALTVVALNALAFFGVHNLTPRYTASADLLVGPREEQVVDLKAVLSGLSGSSDVIESEIQVLRSREIARGVVRALNLDQMSEFNPSLREPGLRQRIAENVGEAFEWGRTKLTPLIGAPTLPDHARVEPSPVARSSAIAVERSEPPDPLSGPVDRFLSQLDVASKGRSRVITISFTSTNAALAAKVPNAVADAYIANQLSAKTNATSQAHKWLDDRVAELREQLLGADEAVEDYRRRAGIVPIRDSTLLNQQISEVGQELMRAHEQVAIAEGRLSAMSRVNPNAMGLTRDVASAKAHEQTLEASLASLRKQVDVGSQSEIGLRALQREADADRNLYDRLLARARETKIQSGLQQADANVISRAERPDEPSFPKPAVILPLFFVASALIGVLLVVWLESLDRGFSTLEQLEGMLSMATIGAVPLIRRSVRRRSKIDTYCIAQPKSSYAEAVRNLHTGLMLSGKDAPPKTILIASSLPGEGKSSLALAMASIMANCGKRVVVVDCDLRRPAVHASFDIPRGPGLTEFLAGEASLDTVVRLDPATSVYVLPAGGETMTAPDLFASTMMRDLLTILAATYDLVLLDGAPVLGVSDSRHLCRIADKTVFLVRWQDTRCSAAMLGLRQLVDAGANIAGTLLTMVDPKQYQKYTPVGLYRRRLALYLGT